MTNKSKVFTKTMLEDCADDVIAKVSDSWTKEIAIEGFSKPIDADALKNIMNETNKVMFEMITEAMGVSYLKKNSVVNTADVETAIILRNKGIETTLQTLDDSWEN